jgi:hypothetical protein
MASGPTIAQAGVAEQPIEGLTYGHFPGYGRRTLCGHSTRIQYELKRRLSRQFEQSAIERLRRNVDGYLGIEISGEN